MIIKNDCTFHLLGKNTSYILIIGPQGDLLHYYYGNKLKKRNYSAMLPQKGVPVFCTEHQHITLELFQQEYPSYGYTDLRHPAYIVENSDLNSISHLKFKSYEIEYDSVQQIIGLPHLFLGDKTAQTLKINLYDDIIDFGVELAYTVFDEYDVILRSSRITNYSQKPITLESAYSMNLDLPKNDYDVIYFSGDWCRERDLLRLPMEQGSKLDLSNARGGSGPDINPFVIVAEKNTTETTGNAYGFTLIYSGNHSTYLECDRHKNLRIQQGINPFQFSWKLNNGESFQTPQSVLCFSPNGLGGMSRELNDVFRTNLCKSKWMNIERPILINHWEATRFDFTEDKLIEIAKKAKETGIELFVIDDGWFGCRNDDCSSLGDWFVNKKKLPSGIEGIAKKINQIGLKFGLWIEPEMISPDSDLYRTHPDWAIKVPNREPALGRNQLILDLTRDDVCQYIISSICDLIGSANIEYVKWDMNRSMSDMPYKGFNHKFYLGLYKILDAITKAFPEVLFEGCSGGGGRFDAGILAYMPQIWTSDNSDAIARLKIQYSTSMGYPISSLSNHVSATPNHQVGRVTSLKTRADVAYAGTFGYELDITKMNDHEIEILKNQIHHVRQLRSLSINGDFYRLISPYDSNYCVWSIVSKDKSEIFVMACRILNFAHIEEQKIKLQGLNPNYDYIDVLTNSLFHGDELMFTGFTPKFEGDFSTYTLHLKMAL